MTDDDEIREELEHQFFLAEMRKLQEKIFWRALNIDFETGVRLYGDIRVYGDEPTFTSILFDKIIEENSE